jgi:hypothetical protein
MSSANFKLTILSDDDGDGVVQLDISITTELYKTSLDHYMSLEYFKEFGNALKEFPANPKNCILELGEDSDRPYIYLSLRAYIYDTLGHAGLEVKMRRNGAAIISASSHFSIATEVASINALGQALSDWVDSGEKMLSFDLYTGMH